MKSGLEKTAMIQTLFEIEAFQSEDSSTKMSTRLTQDTAIHKTLGANGNSSYEPLSSVWLKSDAELLDAMLNFYATIRPEPILDATYNAGRFWKGSNRRVVSMDIDPRSVFERLFGAPGSDADRTRRLRQNRSILDSVKEDVDDLSRVLGPRDREMTGVRSARFGAVVYDPPHVGPQGRDKSKKRFDVDFGATVECGKQHDWNLSYLYPPFLQQAKRVLKPNGLLLAKITDMVNNHKSKWPHVDFMRMAEKAGFTVCDLIVKVRSGPMVSNKWKVAHHARKRHCFWIVCRNSKECEREIKSIRPIESAYDTARISSMK